MGSDRSVKLSRSRSFIFQSTLPAWGATKDQNDKIFDAKFQSTLPAWGATESPVIINPVVQFQSTLPAWGATVQPKHTAMTA